MTKKKKGIPSQTLSVDRLHASRSTLMCSNLMLTRNNLGPAPPHPFSLRRWQHAICKHSSQTAAHWAPIAAVSPAARLKKLAL